MFMIFSNNKTKAELLQDDEDPYTYYENLHFTELSLGNMHSAAITNTGKLFTWGYNWDGELGDGTTENKNTPTEITNNLDLVGEEWTDAGVTVTDNSLEELQIIVTGEVDTNKIGTYEIVYKATDSSGNTSLVTRYVHVVE